MRWMYLTLAAAACSSAPREFTPHADATIDSPPPDTMACGQRSGMRGKTLRTITAGGLTRTYIVYLPDGDPAKPMPFLYVMHGYTMSGQAMYDVTQLPALADKEHVAIVFPDGQGGPDSNIAPWNV